MKITECLAHSKCSINVSYYYLLVFCIVVYFLHKLHSPRGQTLGLTCLSLKLQHLEQSLAHNRHSVNIFIYLFI